MRGQPTVWGCGRDSEGNFCCYDNYYYPFPRLGESNRHASGQGFPLSHKTRHLWLDHSIVGQSLLTNFEFRKDREYAFCRICGDIFQSPVALAANDVEWEDDPLLKVATELDTRNWRIEHNKTHSERVHKVFIASGRFLSPEAAHKLAPYGIAPLSDMILDGEVEDAASTAPRAPVAEVQTR